MNLEETSNSNSQYSDYDEVQVHCKKQDKAMYIKYYLSNRERKALIDQCGDAGCMLYEFYLRMASKTETNAEDYSDVNAAEYFGWDKQKAKRNRLKLVKAKWFDTQNFKYFDKRKGISFYVGPDSVPQ